MDAMIEMSPLQMEAAGRLTRLMRGEGQDVDQVPSELKSRLNSDARFHEQMMGKIEDGTSWTPREKALGAVARREQQLARKGRGR